MNWETIKVLFIHELRQLLRDRRTVILSAGLPLILTPLILFAGKTTSERREKALQEVTYRYSIIGTNSENIRQIIERQRKLLAEFAKNENASVRSVGFKIEEIESKDPLSALKSSKIDILLEALSGAEADELADGAVRSQGIANNQDQYKLKGLPLIRIYYEGNNDRSQTGLTKMRELLARARRAGRDELLQESGFAVKTKNIFPLSDNNIATSGQVSGSMIGRFLTLFLLTLMLTGGSVAAIDIIAGEKERGTLETLLTTAAARSEIVAAKQLAVSAVAVAITLIQAANILVYLTFKIIKLPQDFVIQVPLKAILALLLLYIPLAALASAVLVMLSGYAKTYKEAQLYFLPVYLLSLAPASAGILPGVSLRSAIAVVPIANVSVAVREIMVGRFDWQMIFIVFVVMTASAALMVRASAKMLSEERLIMSSESDSAFLEGSRAVFSQHVLKWYAVMWALLLAVATNVPQLSTLRRQLLFNQLAIFLGGSLLMIWKYRLNVKEALSLRPVKPIVWLAVLMAVPSGYLVSIGVFRLANLFVPVPRQALEQFSKQLLPSDIPTWELFLFIAILPAICEEICFRGTLLYGLKNRFKPAPLVLLVGLIFGLFHISLFRIIPTGFLGVVLTAMALLTGSIFPCMVAHAANNGFAIWAALQGYQLQNLDWRIYIAASAVFALCFYILYRVRSKDICHREHRDH